MKKSTALITTLVTTGIVAASGAGIASAASSNNANVGSSDIPRSVFREERQSAVAQVLNTTTTNIQSAHKNHTLKNLISQAGLTEQTFGQKVKAQLTSDLESKGYSQDQITIALQHKEIVRLHHKDKSHQKES